MTRRTFLLEVPQRNELAVVELTVEPDESSPSECLTNVVEFPTATRRRRNVTGTEHCEVCGEQSLVVNTERGTTFCFSCFSGGVIA